MSEAKFTKGEWRVEIVNRDAKVYYPHGFLTSANIIKIDDSKLDGESWLEMRDRTRPLRKAAKVESNANMHLIAAAPELYELLEKIANEAGYYESRTGATVTWREKADQLLAKARGEK